MVAVAGLGVSLGIALRLLSEIPDVPGGHCLSLGKWAKRRVAIGMGLNLLEPPAIMLAIGLSLGQQPASLTPGVVWGTFAAWIIPLTLLAAAGESLWLGVYQAVDQESHNAGPSPAESDSDPREDA